MFLTIYFYCHVTSILSVKLFVKVLAEIRSGLTYKTEVVHKHIQIICYLMHSLLSHKYKKLKSMRPSICVVPSPVALGSWRCGGPRLLAGERISVICLACFLVSFQDGEVTATS
jgi:hypothetical protein